ALKVALNKDLRRRELNKLSDDMLDCILDNDSEKLRKQFDQYLSMIETFFPSLERFKREVLQILCFLSEFYGEKERANMWFSGLYFHELLDMDTYSEVIKYSKEIIEKIIGNMETQNFDVNHRDIKLALEYIGSNYNEDIGLNELAQIVDLNPAYLSVLFKKEV